ncbi:MAG: class I SAM-dependent methyltransferase [Parvularculaceae bacterium]
MSGLPATLSRAAKGAAYGASQLARIAWFTGHYAAGRLRMGPVGDSGSRKGAAPPLDRRALREAFIDLFKSDWRNIDEGQYKLPAEALRPPRLDDLWRRSRDYFQDTEEVSRRKSVRGHSEVHESGLADKYPRYFLQNFHYQSDGWMSAASAERYDMQVETLFTGAAAAMRRQALPAIRRAIGARDPSGLQLLDLACGTGAFLDGVKENWPLINVTALDLSPAYLGKARTTLGRRRNVSFLEANAEVTGLPDGAFDMIACVYLFHELPPKARDAVAAEIGRLLKPGGTLIQVDTIQYGDQPGLDSLLDGFPKAFHEPYYESYCRQNLETLFDAAGLVRNEPAQLAFLSKITVLMKRQVCAASTARASL